MRHLGRKIDMEATDPQLNDASKDVRFEVEVEGWDVNPIFFFILLLGGLVLRSVFSFIFSLQGIVTLAFAFGIYMVIKSLISKRK